jgi:hypothetical protein
MAMEKEKRESHGQLTKDRSTVCGTTSTIGSRDKEKQMSGTLHSTRVTSTGGRHGSIRSDDGRFELKLALPRTEPRYCLIAVIPLTASVNPDQTPATFEAHELVLRLVKCGIAGPKSLVRQSRSAVPLAPVNSMFQVSGGY